MKQGHNRYASKLAAFLSGLQYQTLTHKYTPSTTKKKEKEREKVPAHHCQHRKQQRLNRAFFSLSLSLSLSLRFFPVHIHTRTPSVCACARVQSAYPIANICHSSFQRSLSLFCAMSASRAHTSHRIAQAVYGRRTSQPARPFSSEKNRISSTANAHIRAHSSPPMNNAGTPALHIPHPSQSAETPTWHTLTRAFTLNPPDQVHEK